MIATKVLSDKEIIKQVLAGGTTLYEVIGRRYNPYLYKVGRSYNYNHEDAMDLVQETHINAFKHLSQFKGKASFKTWIVRVMLNNCYDKKQKFSYQKEFSQDLHENSKPFFMNTNNDAHKTIDSRELGAFIEQALGEIPEKYRMVFSLREIEGFNVSETAQTLDITRSNVKVRLNRAKAMLRKKIEHSYDAHELFEFNLVYCDIITENVMKRIKEM